MESHKPIRDETLLWIFALSILAVMQVIPRVFNLSVNSLSQYLAYLAGFLLAVDFLGRQRVDIADATLTTNADYISRKFTEFLLFYYLLKVDDPKERREMLMWYIFSVLDTALALILITYTLPRLGIKVGPWLKANLTPGKIWLGSLILCFVPMIVTFLATMVDIFLVQIFRRKIRTNPIVRNIAFIPVLIIGGPVILPWLAYVGITWGILQGLLLVVRLKARLRLGSVFMVLGFLFLLGSFLFFVLDQIDGKGS